MYSGSLAVAGEYMGTRPFSMYCEPEFLDMIRILREADTTYCHLEMNIFNQASGCPGRAFALSALQADPAVAHDLKWAGINLVSCAFNHALDWGMPGLLGTIQSLDQAGIVHAGSGNNLEEAREPAYFESRAGRVAIISMSSGHHPYDSASPVKAPVRGRPGVNPLRFQQKYVVPQRVLDNLKEAWNLLGLGMNRPLRIQGEEGDHYLVSGSFGNEAALIFRVGDQPEVQSIPDQWDIEGNLRAIRDARRQADLVLVAHHAHVIEGKGWGRVASFVPAFAKECIDAGADIYVGHGIHRPLGIELYKGKPILYGTGNFFAQTQFQQRFPADAYEGQGINSGDVHKLTPVDLQDVTEKQMPHTSDYPGGIIAALSVDSGKFKEIKLYPYSMGYDWGTGGRTGLKRQTGARMDGRPVLTYGENAEKIISHVKKCSEAYNTNVEYKNGIGIVDLG